MSAPLRPIRMILIALIAFLHGSAQQEFSKDSLFGLGKKPSDLAIGKFPWKGMVVPAALTGYGIIAIRSKPLWNLNDQIQDELWNNRPHDLNHMDDYLRFVPALAVYGLNMAGVKGKHDLKDRTMILAISTAVMGGTVFTLKHVVKERSPTNRDSLAYHSFPSGHTAEAFMTAEFLWQEYHERSPWYGIAGYACAIATGYLRLYNNQHWFSDVVAGAGIGIASTKFAYWLYPKIKRAFSKDKSMNSMVLPYYRIGEAGLHWVSRL